MFGMNGFHVSASGAIQGHHGPLVIDMSKKKCVECTVIWGRKNSTLTCVVRTWYGKFLLAIDGRVRTLNLKFKIG